jgi:hypothetical protein
MSETSKSCHSWGFVHVLRVSFSFYLNTFSPILFYKKIVNCWQSYCYGNESLDNWRDPAIVPECLSTQLRTCLLKGYRNTECEIQFAKYILQNSKVLNTMSIKSASDLELNVKYQMITKLTLSRRASTTCELLFDW